MTLRGPSTPAGECPVIPSSAGSVTPLRAESVCSSVVEHLSSMHESQGSILAVAKRKETIDLCLSNGSPTQRSGLPELHY